MQAHEAGGLVAPVISGTVRPLQDFPRISEKPDFQSAGNAHSAKYWIFSKEAAKVIEHAEVMHCIVWIWYLGKFGVVAPGAEVRCRINRRLISDLLGEENAAGDCKQVSMLLIAPIKKMPFTVNGKKLAKQDWRRNGLSYISQ